MSRSILRFCFALLLAAAGSSGWAQSCSITANNLASGSGYNPFLLTTNDTAGVFSVSCTRPKGGQNKFPATFYVGVDNGGNYSGTTRQLRLGASGNYLTYSLYRNYSGCSQAWGATLATAVSLANSGTGGNDTTTIPNPLTSGTSYCFRIDAGQNAAPPGTYTDTVTIGVADNTGAIWGSGTITFSTTITAACSFTSPPTNMTLNYTSFTTTAATATSNLQLRCTNTTTYGLALSGTSGTMLGLNYTLGLSAASGTGSGLAQAYAINAGIAAGQSGTCSGASCTATVTRTLTVTY
ncbi:spore coat U domain-containing protein [Ramlibacter sp. XY19]|uniref:spore coat protein U domain-containing protein n=1 Tax=Ramlibacter paludis TaxID=2908000 RepID=UPI0023DB9595|nr:spore coat protein U domain-containing protein [Ramlibacter paludis]MCG2594915.1 spore coat U domain-containing protein [Ramlibacter paludis]